MLPKEAAVSDTLLRKIQSFRKICCRLAEYLFNRLHTERFGKRTARRICWLKTPQKDLKIAVELL